MEGSTLSYIRIRFLPKVSRRALIDMGASANVISKKVYKEFKTDPKIKAHMTIEESNLKSVKMAGGQIVSIDFQVELQ